MKTTENTILITGAASGIGLEIAKLFSRQNNKVIMADKATAELEAEAAKLTNAIAITVDLADENDITKFIETLRAEHKDLNIAVLNAAVAHHYALFSPGYQLASAIAEINTNYIANVRLTNELEPLLSSKKDAAFVITTSALAFVPSVQYPTYSVTKAALHSYILSARLTLNRKGSTIKVFDLMPPLTETPLTKETDVPKITAAEVAAWFMNSFENDELEIHVGRTGNLFELFLKSPTEALMTVNGGN